LGKKSKNNQKRNLTNAKKPKKNILIYKVLLSRQRLKHKTKLSNTPNSEKRKKLDG